MDFQSSKENIQPLRGGRNVSQLDMALQAQDNTELQNELAHQREQYENDIKNYNGDDPLSVWYEYISWIEQCFPKHGLEGNLITLLEDCLSKFEYDKRYYEDRRLCKLFIKYIDMQQNPLDLYQILYARGVGRGVADLYRAWAYYHEAVGDYCHADSIFQMGRRELAQPYDDLDMAHRNLIFAAGLQVISGNNESRLIEQRKALTSLQTYKAGTVGSVRIGNDQLPVMPVMPSTSRVPKSNSALFVYEDTAHYEDQGAVALLPSVLSIAKRQDTKENILHPGTWTQTPQHKITAAAPSITPFKVHEDNNIVDELQGLRLPPRFFPLSNEGFLDLKPDIYFKEPSDPSKLSMYPKSIVYSCPTTEYSLEEIKARHYLKRHREKSNFSDTVKEAVSTEALVPPILPNIVEHNKLVHHVYNEEPSHSNVQHHVALLNHSTHNSFQGLEIVDHPQHYEFPKDHSFHSTEPYSPQQPYQQRPDFSFYTDSICHNDQNDAIPPPVLENNYVAQNYQFPPTNVFQSHQNLPKNLSQSENVMYPQPSTSLQHGDCYDISFHKPELNESNNNVCRDFFNDIFNSNNSPKQTRVFGIYDDQNVQQTGVPRGTALKTPLKDISADDLAETGSRGGLEIAAAAQPCDEAKRITVFEDETNVYLAPPRAPTVALDETVNTMMFHFNSNLKQSTPSKLNDESVAMGNKTKALSVIIEEKGSGSAECIFKQHPSSGSSNFHSEEDRYNYNLAQNSKVNEQLRTSLLEFMDCESHPSSPITEKLPLPPQINIPELNNTSNTVVPSDPFKPAFINRLLETVAFPGRHQLHFNTIPSMPKISVNMKKECTYIGNDKYYMQKCLGKGTFGSVYKAINVMGDAIALKIQRPPNKWEFYICRELQARLAEHPLKERFMSVDIGYFCEQGSIIVSEYSPNGSLLQLANTLKQKSGRSMKEGLCIFFCLEMLKIVEIMHNIKIIHADIKPDNFLVFLRGNDVHLQLIDFGCSIDMSLLPPNATFTRRVTTQNFICCEMLDGRPWSYHTDMFCIGATAHVLLFDKYITVQKMDNHWSLTQKFTRYWNVPLWTEFFSTLLNQQECVANNKHLQILLENSLHNSSEFQNDLRLVKNLLKNR